MQDIQHVARLPVKYVHEPVVASPHHHSTIFTELYLFGVPLRWHARWKVANE